MVSKRDLNSSEWETMRISKIPTTVMTANGEVQTREEATVYVKELDLFVTVMLLEETPAILFLGSSVRIMGIPTIGPGAKKPHLTQNGKKYQLQYSELCTIRCPWFIDEFLYLSSPASSTSSSQDTVISTENPATERSEIMSEESRGNPSRGSAETENTNRNEDDEDYEVNYCKMCRNGYRISKKNLVDKNVQPHQYSPSSCHELPNELRAKSGTGLGLAQYLYSLPERPKLWHLLEDYNYNGFVQKTHWITNFSLKEVNHATIIDMPWWYKIWQLSGYNLTHVKTKTSQETQKSLMKFLEPDEETTSHSHWQFLVIWQVLWRINLESLYVNTTQIGNKWDCWERAIRRVKEGTSAVLFQSGLDNEWWPDSMECYCFLRNIQDLLSDGRHHMKGGSRENLVDDEIPEHGDSHASSFYGSSLEPTCKRCEDLGKHSVYTHFLKTEIARSVKGPKIPRARAEDAMAEPYLVLKIFLTW